MIPCSKCTFPKRKAQEAAADRPWHQGEMWILTFRPVYIPEAAELSGGDPPRKGTAGAVHEISAGTDEDLFITILWYLCVPTTWAPQSLKSHLAFWACDILSSETHLG